VLEVLWSRPRVEACLAGLSTLGDSPLRGFKEVLAEATLQLGHPRRHPGDQAASWGVGRAELGHDQRSEPRSPLPAPGGRQPPGPGGAASQRARPGMTGPAGAGPERHGCSATPRAQLGATSSRGRPPRADGAAGSSSRNGRLTMAFLVMWQAEVPPPNLAMLRRRSRPQGARVRVLGACLGCWPKPWGWTASAGASKIGPGPGRPNRLVRWVKEVAVCAGVRSGQGRGPRRGHARR